MDNVLKNVQVPVPTPVKQTTQSTAAPTRPSQPAQQQGPSTTPPGVSASQKQSLINQIVSVGFTAQQAEEALWATNYSSADAAIEFLLSQ